MVKKIGLVDYTDYISEIYLKLFHRGGINCIMRVGWMNWNRKLIFKSWMFFLFTRVLISKGMLYN